jgi:hypothetical protein
MRVDSTSILKTDFVPLKLPGFEPFELKREVTSRGRPIEFIPKLTELAGAESPGNNRARRSRTCRKPGTTTAPPNVSQSATI